MNNKKIFSVILFSLFIAPLLCVSQINHSPYFNKFAISVNNGGYWQAYNYGLKSLNYNVNILGEYRINKNISTVINTGFDFQYFREERFSLDPGLHLSSSTKLVMFELTAGVNYYIPVQKSSEFYFSANLGNYVERVNNNPGDFTLPKKRVDDKWSGRFGINSGIGFESAFYNNIEWTFQAKYHYIFDDADNMKFVNINIGFKYNL